MKTFFLLFCCLLFSSPHLGFTETTVAHLSQKVSFKTGDLIQLSGRQFTIQIGADPGTKCAVPGFNCGSGYSPPHPTYKIDCGEKKPCPYVILASHQSATQGSLSIEDEASCERNDPPNCFREFSRQFMTDEECRQLKTPLGRYHCLDRFDSSARDENKSLCDQLPDSIFALKWNCYYEFAVRYRDPKFCDKYPVKEVSGRDRCLLKMAEILKDKSLCQKISLSKDHSYKDQCLSL